METAILVWLISFVIVLPLYLHDIWMLRTKGFSIKNQIFGVFERPDQCSIIAAILWGLVTCAIAPVAIAWLLFKHIFTWIEWLYNRTNLYKSFLKE